MSGHCPSCGMDDTPRTRRLTPVQMSCTHPWHYGEAVEDLPPMPPLVRIPQPRTFSESEVIVILTNVGVDTACGACMSMAFTGVNTTPHTCEGKKR